MKILHVRFSLNRNNFHQYRFLSLTIESVFLIFKIFSQIFYPKLLLQVESSENKRNELKLQNEVFETFPIQILVSVSHSTFVLHSIVLRFSNESRKK